MSLTASARRAALAVVAAAFVMDILDLTIVNVAIPTLQSHLSAGNSSIQWMVAGYATVFATLLVSGGRLGDIFGYRRMLLFGVAGFTAASLLCGLAPDPTVLVAARLVQAAGAAVMLPQVMSLVQIMYAPAERVNALGLFGVLGGTAGVSGPVLGGLIIGADLFGLGWRPIFLINVPIGIGLLIAGPRLLPDHRSSYRPSMDWNGTALATLLLFELLFPVIQGRALGWPWWCGALLAATLPTALALAQHSRRQLRLGRPTLFVPSLLREPSFVSGMTMSLLYQAAVASLLFTLALTLQEGLRFTPATAGIAHIPYAVGSSVSIALLARRLMPRYGARLIGFGAVTMIAGLALLALILNLARADAITAALLAPAMLLMGLGMGLTAGPLTPSALARVDIGHAGAASGLLKMVQEVGGAFGVAIIGGMYFGASRIGGGDHVAAQNGAMIAMAACLALVAIISARTETRVSSPPAAAGLPPQPGAAQDA